MEFRTVANIEKQPFSIDHSMRGFLVGSCFAENIFSHFSKGKFHASKNPFGVIFNPVSIVRTLVDIESQRVFSKDDLIENNGLWCSFSHHGSFSGIDQAEVLSNLNRSVTSSHDTLINADYIIITLGTAWVYKYIKTEEIVNNCHKIDSRKFERYKLEVNDITTAFDSLLSKDIYKSKKIIFTVSPVRHLSDGVAENQLSKSTLIVAIHQIVKKYSNAVYFPAYEIMMDDLRDYRFYDPDMTHPSKTAIEYIFERFSEVFFEADTKKLLAELQKISAATEHRPFNPNTEAHLKFKESTLKKIETIEASNKYINLDPEKKHFKK